jgi:hypothetical protein
MMTWTENVQIGDYRLRERQFRGTASASWLAEVVATGDLVRLASLEVPSSLETMREPIVNAIRQALEQGDRLRDVGLVPGTLQTQNGTVLTVTPCPDGPTLRQKIDAKRSGRGEGLEAELVIAAAIANVIACSHEHQLAHGFLTPEQIFITPDGRAQVLEFGIHAPAIGSVWPGPTDGSPYWPKSARIAADPFRRDLYALGVILYEIFTGAPPTELNGAAVAERLVAALPDKLPRSLPPKIAAAILQDEKSEEVTPRQLAVQLTFARSWVRAVSRGESAPTESATEEAPETEETAPARTPTPPTPATPARGQAALQEARMPAERSEIMVTAPPPPQEAPMPMALPPMMERLPIWAWCAGLACGLFAAAGLAGGIYLGTTWNNPGRGARVAGVQEELPRSTFRFDFEDGTTMGWKSRASAPFVTGTTAVAHGGKGALQVRLRGTDSDSPGQIWFQPSATVGPGNPVRMFVLVPYGSQAGLTAKAYVQDREWKWNDGGITRLQPGVWTELRVEVPQDALLPLKAIGIHFEADPRWSGRLFVDDVLQEP